MTSIYERGLGRNEFKLLSRGQEIKLARPVVFSELGVERTIRIPLGDYPENFNPGETIVHFGLPIPIDPPGTKVVLSKILRNGYFKSDGKEELPLLSFENVWVATVESCIESVPYELLPENCFKNAVGGAKDIESLKELILARYSKSVPEFGREKILSQGVSIRYLKLIRKAAFS